MYQSVDCINPTRLVSVCMIYNIMYGVGNVIVLLFQNVDLKESGEYSFDYVTCTHKLY